MFNHLNYVSFVIYIYKKQIKQYFIKTNQFSFKKKRITQKSRDVYELGNTLTFKKINDMGKRYSYVNLLPYTYKCKS